MKVLATHITPVVIVVIRRDDGAYLLTDRVERDFEDKQVVVGDDFWQLPGGGVEVGETLEQTAVREAKEELGIDVEIVRMIAHVYTALRPRWHGLLISYLCRQKDPQQQIILNHESSTYGWFYQHEIKSLNTFPETYDTVMRAEALVK